MITPSKPEESLNKEDTAEYQDPRDPKKSNQILNNNINVYFVALNEGSFLLFVTSLGCWSVDNYWFKLFAISLTIALSLVVLGRARKKSDPFFHKMNDLPDMFINSPQLNHHQSKKQTIRHRKLIKRLGLWESLMQLWPFYLCCSFAILSLIYFLFYQDSNIIDKLNPTSTYSVNLIFPLS